MMRRIQEWVLDGATVAAAIAAVIIAGTIVTDRLTGDPLARESRSVDEWQQYLASGHRKGAPEPTMTILEFGDYQCPGCRRFHRIVEEFLARHAGEVAFVYRHWPLDQHLDAYPAARAAECAALQDRFWAFHEKLYSERWTRSSFLTFAAEINVPDLDAFEQCIGDTAAVPSIEEDIEAAVKLDAFGTPAVIVDGTLLGQAPDQEQLDALLREAKDG